jgi:hypothetical protein
VGRTLRVVLIAALAWPLLGSAADVLYAASVRGPAADGTHLIAGNLYTIDPATGVATLVGGLRTRLAAPLSVTGLADHPKTGVLYGITTESSPNHRRALVTIDPTTAEANVIGRLGVSGSDVTFDREGRLYIWLRGTSQIGTVDLETGHATAIGTPGPPNETGGIAIDPAGRIHLAASGASGTLDVIDPQTGEITRGPTLHGAPFPAGINSLAYSPTGTLLAVNTNLGSPAITVLVSIDTVTGRVTQVAPLPSDTDALVYVRTTQTTMRSLTLQESLLIGAAGIALVFLLAVYARTREKPD